MKKFLFIAGILLLLAAGGYKLTQSDSKQPIQPSAANLPEGEIAVVVIMNDDGYEPSTFTLKAGQAIRFTNSGNGNRWPASNIHPTHQLYPEFDPKKEIKPGDSWTFTFIKKGSWRMHDHLSPYIKGLIIVE